MVSSSTTPTSRLSSNEEGTRGYSVEIGVMLRFRHAPNRLVATLMRTGVDRLLRESYSTLLKLTSYGEGNVGQEVIVEVDRADPLFSIASFSFVTVDTELDLIQKCEECRLLVERNIGFPVEIIGQNETCGSTSNLEEFTGT